MLLDPVAVAQALNPQDASSTRVVWGIVQSNDSNGTAKVRLSGSTTTLTIPYATSHPAKPGSKVGVTANGPDVAITHIVAPSGPPCAKVNRLLSAQAFTTAVDAAVTFDTVGSDPWGMWNSSDGITVPVTGWYALSAGWNFAANATGTRAAYFSVDGAPITYDRETPTAAFSVNASIAAMHYITAGQVVKLNAVQTSGGNLNLAAAAAWDAFLSVTWIGWGGAAASYGPELQENAGAEALSLTGHSSFWSGGGDSVTTTAGEFSTGAAGFKCAVGAASQWVFQGSPMVVTPGQVLRISVTVKSSVATTGAAGSGVSVEMLYSSVNTNPDYFQPDVGSLTVMAWTATTTSFKTVTVEWTVPDNVYFIRPTWRTGHTAATTQYVDECSIKSKDLS